MQRGLSQEVVSLFGLLRVVTMVRGQKGVVGVGDQSKTLPQYSIMQ